MQPLTTQLTIQLTTQLVTSHPSKLIRLCSCALILAVGGVVTSQVNAQTCNDSITKTAPDSRYEVLAGGSEVKDSQTGLIWQRCTLGQTWDGTTCSGTASTHNWSQALSQAKNLGNGYRLPNIKELISLVEEACYSPAINESIFPNSQSGGYWSASPRAYTFVENGNGVDAIGFRTGSTGYNLKNNSLYVRAVRESR